MGSAPQELMQSAPHGHIQLASQQLTQLVSQQLIQNVDSQGIMQRAPATQQRAPQQLQQFARLQPMQYAQLAPQQLTKDHSRQITQNASASQQLTQRASPADAVATAATAPAKKLCHLLVACQPAAYTMQSCLLLSSNQRVAQRGEIESKPLTAGTQQQLQLAAETAMTPKQLAQLISAATERLSQPAIAPQLTKAGLAKAATAPQQSAQRSHEQLVAFESAHVAVRQPAHTSAALKSTHAATPKSASTTQWPDDITAAAIAATAKQLQHALTSQDLIPASAGHRSLTSVLVTTANCNSSALPSYNQRKLPGGGVTDIHFTQPLTQHMPTPQQLVSLTAKYGQPEAFNCGRRTASNCERITYSSLDSASTTAKQTALVAAVLKSAHAAKQLALIAAASKHVSTAAVESTPDAAVHKPAVLISAAKISTPTA